MTIANQLIEAKALIEDPQHWVQGQYAVDKNGISIAPPRENACQWCAMGAVMKVGTQEGWLSEFRGSDECKWLGNAAKYVFNTTLMKVNDQKGHAAVMAVYDEAIKQAREARI